MPIPLEEISAGREEKGMPRIEYGARDPHLGGLFANREVEDAIRQLSECNRATFLLHDVQGYRHAEIAGMLGCSVGASKSQVHRARKELRRLLTVGHLSTMARASRARTQPAAQCVYRSTER